MAVSSPSTQSSSVAPANCLPSMTFPRTSVSYGVPPTSATATRASRSRCPWEATTSLADDFHAAHDRLYHYSRPDEVPFLVNIEIHAEGRHQAPALSQLDAADRPCEPIGTRKIFVLDSSEWTDAGVYRRDALAAGDRISGPAVVDQLDSTVVILPGFSAEVDPFGTMILTRMEGA